MLPESRRAKRRGRDKTRELVASSRYESCFSGEVRIALEHAASVAGVLLLTEATLTEVPEPTRESLPSADAQ